MKKFLIFLFVVLVSVWLGIKIHQDPGYAVLSWRHTLVEMPLWLALFAWLIGYVLLFYTIKVLRISSVVSLQYQQWQSKRRKVKADAQTSKGLLALAEGKWKVAERYLSAAAKNSDTPLINYLAAAQAAQYQGEDKRRDQYLSMAHEHTPHADVPIGLTHAQLQIAHQQYEQALATLMRLKQVAHKHPFVLELLYKVYLELGDDEKLLELLPELKKYKVIDAQRADSIRQDGYKHLFEKECIHLQDTASLKERWKALPRALQHVSDIIRIYASKLITLGAHQEAQSVLQHALSQQFDSQLATLYGHIKAVPAEKSLHFAENLLASHPENAHLLLALGRLCIHNKLWGKAKHYFDLAQQFSDNPEVYAELGALQERLDEKDAALNTYRKGIELLSKQNI